MVVSLARSTARNFIPLSLSPGMYPDVKRSLFLFRDLRAARDTAVHEYYTVIRVPYEHTRDPPELC